METFNMKPYTQVSVDGRAAQPTERYRDCRERKCNAVFDQELEALLALHRRFLVAGKNAAETPLMCQSHKHHYSVPDDTAMQERIRADWNIDVRLRELDGEGIVGEVLSPESPGSSNYTVHDLTNGWVNTYGGFARNMRRSLDS
jgi:hypothetical protein